MIEMCRISSLLCLRNANGTSHGTLGSWIALVQQTIMFLNHLLNVNNNYLLFISHCARNFMFY